MAKTILVADDEVHIVRILKDTLEKRGYTVITAADGREAVDLAVAEQPDLIFLDDGGEDDQYVKRGNNTVESGPANYLFIDR